MSIRKTLPHILFLMICAVPALIAACSRSPAVERVVVYVTATPQVVHVVVTDRPSPTATQVEPTPTPTTTPWVRPTQGPTYTPTATPTATEPPAIPLAYQGESYPRSAVKIGLTSLEKLVFAARWGRGTIDRVAYARDGSFFTVASHYGVMVYESANWNAEPRWIPFAAPIRVVDLLISMNGEYLQISDGEKTRYMSLEEGTMISRPEDAEWIERQVQGEGYRGLEMLSPDGTVIYRGSIGCVYLEGYDECSTLEAAYQSLRLVESDEVYYRVQDPVPPVQYAEWNEPLGCDLDSFGYCGNAFMPSANGPYRGAFSPDGETFAVLYRPPNLWSTNRFSVLRVFRTSDGEMIRAIGSYTNPVEDFAYAPDSGRILAGFVDGSVRLIEIETGEDRHASRHFGSPIQYMEYTADGDFLLIQRANELEVRRSTDGALRARFDAVTFAQTADGSRLALASLENEIRVIDLATWEDVHRFTAHDDVIFTLAFSDDGRLLASAGQDCRIKVWDMETGEYLHDYEQVWVDAYGEGYTLSRIFVRHMQFIPGTDRLIGFGSWGTAVTWDVGSGAADYLVGSAPLDFYNGMVTLDLHFPQYFSANAEEGLFYINEMAFSLEDGSVMAPYERPDGLPDGCYEAGPVTPDGTLRFTRGYDRYEGSVCVLDNATLALVDRIVVEPVLAGGWYSDLMWLHLSPDGEQLVAYTCTGAIYVYVVIP